MVLGSSPVAIVVTFEKCDIFSAHYFLYVQGYKAALTGGNKNLISDIFKFDILR